MIFFKYRNFRRYKRYLQLFFIVLFFGYLYWGIYCGHSMQCTAKCASGNYLAKLEAGYKKLKESDSQSLLKKHLTQEIFDKLKTKKTSMGSTLLDCIQSGELFG